MSSEVTEGLLKERPLVITAPKPLTISTTNHLNNKIMKTFQTIILVLICLNLYGQSEDKVIQTKDYLAIEIDPAPFILGGYSFSVKFSPKKNTHISYMASIYSSNFPDKMMSQENFNKGLRDLKIKTSYAVFAD